MTHAQLTKELLDDASSMRLVLRVDRQRLSALIVGQEAVDPVVVSHVEELSDPTVRAVENAVYDNPLLLSDFAAVDIIFSTSELFLYPAETDGIVERMADAMLPDFEAPRTILTEEAMGDARVGYAVDSELLNFLTRTFACARFHHVLALTAQWLSNSAAGFYALYNGPGDMTAVAFTAGSPCYLNRLPAYCPNDCAYYTLIAAEENEEVTLMTIDPDERALIADTIAEVKPSMQLRASALSEPLLNLRRQAPELPFDMLFVTKL